MSCVMVYSWSGLGDQRSRPIASVTRESTDSSWVVLLTRILVFMSHSVRRSYLTCDAAFSMRAATSFGLET
jgi:hypothetical protein